MGESEASQEDLYAMQVRLPPKLKHDEESPNAASCRIRRGKMRVPVLHTT